jgi:hypothetical protein
VSVRATGSDPPEEFAPVFLTAEPRAGPIQAKKEDESTTKRQEDV